MNHPPVGAITAFVPSRDFAVSKRFYLDLGFNVTWDSGDACGLEIDGKGIILQNFYVKDHANNFMMSMSVPDADAWWERIQRLGLKEKYNLGMANPPTLQPWGLRVLYLTDPTGVLWHISDRPKV